MRKHFDCAIILAEQAKSLQGKRITIRRHTS
nr:MAG TPA: hypothetical protein [Bacteriophage sp.]